MLVETPNLDLGPFVGQLETLAVALSVVPQPFAVQQQIAGRLRQVVEDIALNATPGESGAGPWLGSRGTKTLSLFGETMAIIASFDGADQLLWISISDESGLGWHIDYEAAFQPRLESMVGGGLGTLMDMDDSASPLPDDDATRPTLRISVSQGADTLSSNSLTADGSVVDERDWAGHFERGARLAIDRLQTAGPDEEMEGSESDDPGGDEGAMDLLGGAMGGRILRGAVAGLAGAAVAGAAAAARKKSSATSEAEEAPRTPGPPPDAQPPASPPSGPEKPPPQAPPMPTPELPKKVEWHYVSMGKKYGPITEADLRKYLAGGNLAPDTLVWRSGLDQWRPARETAELRGVLPATPQPPPLPIETQWFYAAGEGQAGPVPEEHLKAWLAAGQLPRETLVWNSGLPQWTPASSIPELWN